MNCLWNSLAGRKTYMVAVSALIALGLAWHSGKIDGQRAAEDAVGVVLAVTIRHGLTTSTQTEEEEDEDAEDFLASLPDDVKNDINLLTKFLLASKGKK